MNKKYKKEQNNHLHVCERKSENSSSSFIQYISWQHVCMLLAANVFTQRERPLMTSHIRVGRGSKKASKMGRYIVGQDR